MDHGLKKYIVIGANSIFTFFPSKTPLNFFFTRQNLAVQ